MSSRLHTISPIDGRYTTITSVLSPYMSEFALMKYRVEVEARYLIALSNLDGFGPRTFTDEEQSLLHGLYRINDADAEMIKAIEVEGHDEIPATNHDVKAIEYFMKEKMKDSSIVSELEWIHFGLTSEDVNNISYALMLRDSVEEVLLPVLAEIVGVLNTMAKEHADLAMLARTHGQSASPTTFGKEIKVFVGRLEREYLKLKDITFLAKLNGATGNYNALVAAAPHINWPEFSQTYIQSLSEGHMLGIEYNPLTTQIESHDVFAEVFQIIIRINTILLDFNQDIWRYISDGWVIQKPVEGEIGSSTMPHKVNPIDFENSEGNLGIANALAHFFATKLPVSRLQRDLSDSTVQRNFGVALSHSLIGYRSTLKGLSKIAVNEEEIRTVLNNHPEVLAEAIQTILRAEGVPMSYEKLKEATRGKRLELEDIHEFIQSLEIADEVKVRLMALTPESYTGLATTLARLERE